MEVLALEKRPRSLFPGVGKLKAEGEEASLDAPEGETRQTQTQVNDSNAFFRGGREEFLSIEKSFTFHSSSLLLPEEEKQAVSRVYAFCRKADDVADGNSSTKEKLEMLSEMKKNLQKALEGRKAGDEAVNRFASTALEKGLDAKYAFELLEGLETDCVTKEYASFAELERHCHAVASTVGLLLLPLLSDEKPEKEAIALGKAMQLTNILRDIGEDLKRGRIYLPQDELSAFNASLDGRVNPEFVALMRFQIERARLFYAKALPGVCKLKPSCRAGVAGAITSYSKIFDGIEA